MTTPRILTTAAVAALASVGTALAAESAPKFEEAPFLGRISGGAGVRYDLDRTAARTVVTIDGRTAKVKVTDKATHEYSAFITEAGLRQGRSYKVTIRITGANGQQRSFAKKLYLHRSMNAPKP